MLYSEKQKVASRVAYTFSEDGRKVRMLKKTGEVID
jgi:large subunit ribosomal protein L24